MFPMNSACVIQFTTASALQIGLILRARNVTIVPDYELWEKNLTR